MKLLIVNTLYHPHARGGAERSVQLLAEEMVRRGVKTLVACIAKRDDIYELNGVRIYALKVSNLYWPFEQTGLDRLLKPLWHARDTINAEMARKVGRIVDKEKVTVVHTNNLMGMSVAVWGEAQARAVPVIHTLRDYYLICPRTTMFRHGRNCESPCPECRIFGSFRKASSAQVGSVIGISRFIVDRHRLLGYFRDTPYAVIHNSLDLGIQDESPRERSLPLRVGFFGRIEAQKGITALVQAAMAVGPGKLELIVGGTGDAKLIDDLKAASSGLSIRFLGRIAPNEFFPLVDVLVVPSLWHEPLGRVVLEAYAWGRPVIVSNRGGLPEIVREGETGFVFDPGIPGGLAMILQRCVASPSKLLRMAAECRAYARSFSSEAIGSAYLHAYQSLVSSALGLAQ